MRPPPTRIGNGGRNSPTNARIFAWFTSSEIATIVKSLRSSSRYSAAMCGNSSRQGSHHEAQKFTRVTVPASRAVVTVSPARSGSANGGSKGSRGRSPMRASSGAAGAVLADLVSDERGEIDGAIRPDGHGARVGELGEGRGRRHMDGREPCEGPAQRVEDVDQRGGVGLGAELGDVIRRARCDDGS